MTQTPCLTSSKHSVYPSGYFVKPYCIESKNMLKNKDFLTFVPTGVIDWNRVAEELKGWVALGGVCGG